MQFKSDALLLRYADYKESDRMLTLLTAEGKISASIKGVRKRGAKLSFAAQPFCFGEYVFNRTAGRNTVISASLHDAFYSLGSDIRLFYAASVVTQTCDKLAYEDAESGAFLYLAVKTLKELCLAGGDGAAHVLVSFLLRALSAAGYAVRADRCPVCGALPSGVTRFDFSRGAFTCLDCSEGVRASEITYKTVAAAIGGGALSDGEGAARALKLLCVYFETCADGAPASLHEFLKLK